MPITTTVRTTGLVLLEHEFQVPLDHSRPDGEQITVFAREVADPDGRDRPFLVFLQGGPGFEAPRPTGNPPAPSWLNRALRDYRVLMLDQRGTGRSTPLDEMPGKTAREQADYLTHFRADSIVADAELIRAELTGGQPWSVLGQSFGGFCVTHYLSQAPQGLRQAFLTGGVPPVGLPVDEIYRATYTRILDRVRRYYQRYPADRQRVRDLVATLETEDVRLPGGDRLTARRLRQFGNALGMSDGAERLHYLLELPHTSRAFRYDAEQMPATFGRNPIYAVIHEASYADGGATRWSAERVMPEEYASDTSLLTGEHIFSWMFTDFGALAPFREAAELLAEHPWPRLYDAEALRSNEVAVAAAIYVEDPFVEARFSMETASLIRGMRTWVTNEYDHNGLRVDGARILDRLIELASGRA
jgi:pimeloyl-ACP methyl ester carboxylesterase